MINSIDGDKKTDKDTTTIISRAMAFLIAS